MGYLIDFLNYRPESIIHLTNLKTNFISYSGQEYFKKYRSFPEIRSLEPISFIQIISINFLLKSSRRWYTNNFIKYSSKRIYCENNVTLLWGMSV